MVNLSQGVNGGVRKRHQVNDTVVVRMLMCHVMARPKHINPDGETKRLVAIVSVPLAKRIEQVAKKRGVPVAQIVREQLEKVA